MDNRELFDHDRLLQQLHGVHEEQPIHGVHRVQPTTVYGAERDELERAASIGTEAAQQLARATAASEKGRCDILKGLAAGKDIYTLFAAACECIGKTTGDTAFSAQAAEYVRTVYGAALGAASPLRAELEVVEGRAGKIKAYMEREDISSSDRDTAGRAYRAHLREAERIREQLDA